MTRIESQPAAQLMQSLLQPWYDAVVEPGQAQETVLHKLLKDYARSEYGQQHGAANIDSIADYRRAFPIKTYEEYKPTIERVMAGQGELLLAEEAAGWAITRGTTKGVSKFIPMTPADLRRRISAGRAMMHYVLSESRMDLFEGVNLNLNFPSLAGTLDIEGREIDYGYSSGIYAKHVSAFTPIKSVPSQEEIDSLGAGKTMRDWARRFELALEKCRDKNVTLVGGVYQTAIHFGRHLRKEHKLYPKDLWTPQIMTLGSTPGINTWRRPSLRAFFGPVVIREIYGATEGIFGQQRDRNRAWVPNYDLYFLEVETRSGVKMLHEMQPRETGRLVVSTPVLPRYRIGDIILAFRSPYFRCIGRDKWWTIWQYAWNELATFNLNQL